MNDLRLFEHRGGQHQIVDASPAEVVGEGSSRAHHAMLDFQPRLAGNSLRQVAAKSEIRLRRLFFSYLRP